MGSYQVRCSGGPGVKGDWVIRVPGGGQLCAPGVHLLTWDLLPSRGAPLSSSGVAHLPWLCHPATCPPCHKRIEGQTLQTRISLTTPAEHSAGALG